MNKPKIDKEKAKQAAKKIGDGSVKLLDRLGQGSVAILKSFAKEGQEQSIRPAPKEDRPIIQIERIDKCIHCCRCYTQNRRCCNCSNKKGMSAHPEPVAPKKTMLDGVMEYL